MSRQEDFDKECLELANAFRSVRGAKPHEDIYDLLAEAKRSSNLVKQGDKLQPSTIIVGLWAGSFVVALCALVFVVVAS